MLAVWQADFASLGNFFFEVEAILQLPGPGDVEGFLTDPLEAIKAGIEVKGAVTLPFGLGAANFYGEVSPKRFLLNTSKAFDVAGYVAA